MRKSVGERWIAALTSGEYVQGTGYMCKNGKHCCLGVLGELAVEDGIVTKQQGANGMAYGGTGYGSDDSHLEPVRRIVDWAGLPDSNPMVDGQRLSVWNDEVQLSFDEIAALIREHLLDDDTEEAA